MEKAKYQKTTTKDILKLLKIKNQEKTLHRKSEKKDRYIQEN